MALTATAKPEVKDFTFPKLMISDVLGGVIVLFHAYGEGVCVMTPNTKNYVGRYCNYRNMEDFKDFHGEVTISNV